ncbi:related to hydrolase (HAD superfamily) [Rhynchosporium agropyri]|uniref:Related to hydrolase (HAD superfamily) n=1 Tax=Rhynchosporium agropyri TaxID=914238 RepID=A0A1E1LFT4_9HELO|nr:related to hydrolase (HAD superfamily) [Rhynchosporium agropyri]
MAFNPTEYKVLSFDIYGTLIDWELGIYQGLQPLLSKLPKSDPRHPSQNSPEPNQAIVLDILTSYTKLEAQIQIEHPTLSYPKVLEAIYTRIASQLSLDVSEDEIKEFGSSIGEWPAFPDTVAAMQILSKYYKLVVLSNVDKTSFSRTLSGPLSGVGFDGIYTAEDIGSYKPDLRNFQYMVDNAEKSFSAKKEEVLKVAQSLYHDHIPAKKFGLKPSVWIKRGGDEAAMGGKLEDVKGEVDLVATFTTLGEFAEEVERAFEKS